jgi:hypothetical protein
MGLELLTDELALDRRSAAMFGETVREIQESCAAAIEVLSDILNFDKMRDGKMEVNFAVHRMVEILYDSVKPFSIQVLELAGLYS